MTVTTSPKSAEAPILVEVVRGQMVESRHRAIAAIVDAHGRIAGAWGDIERPIYGRSSIKPLLAIPLIETGAADRFQVSDAEVALATASHSGEVAHVEAVTAWLHRVGLSIDDLECGPQAPRHEPTNRALIASGHAVSRAHNNCSGKHSGFLTTALHLGLPTRDYIQYEHPIQQHLQSVLADMCGLSLGHVPRGIDGCGMPVIATPVANLALAMARMADPHHLPPERQAACQRILRSMTDYPFNVAGTDQFCTIVMETLGGKAAIKAGAEGVYLAALPELGLGVALKIEDGAGRAAEVAMGQVLKRLGVMNVAEEAALAHALRPTVANWAGAKTGVIRPIADANF